MNKSWLKKRTTIFVAFLFAFFVVFSGTVRAADYYNDYSDVLLVINDSSADSVDIGNYFKTARSIPDGHVVHINCTTSDDISLANFTSQIRTPIENFITTNGLTDSINYIVTTKGLPLRNGMGSVDSDLALMLGPNSSKIGASDYVYSTYRGKREPVSHQKFGMYAVTRLTGYTASDAKALVDKATAIVQGVDPGVRGKFVLDTALKTGGYQIGDDWMKAAAPIVQNKGYNVTLDLTTTFLTGQQDVLGYCSWGSNDGHVASPYTIGNTWVPGAIAETYVSTSARSFTPGTTYGQSLVADIIAEGLTGVKGYVQEPYLDSMAQPDILFDRYTAGFNLADSYYMASYYLGRMDLIVGDPKAHIFEDSAAPTITAFTMPATSPSKSIDITSLSATDANSPTASLLYLINESATAPLSSDANWSTVKPASYKVSGEGSRTMYAWVMDSKGNISASASQTVAILDYMAPTIQSFIIPAETDSLTANVSLIATDNAEVSGYLITESSQTPLASDPNWSSSAPTTFSFSGAGVKTAYAWAKDDSGNISTGYPLEVSIVLADTTKPDITVFSLPASAVSNTFSVPLIFKASDNKGVTGYFLSESATAPSPSDSGWSSDVPTSFTFSSAGSKTLHAWAKDASGNVSNVSNASAVVSAEPSGSGVFSQSRWSGGSSASNANQTTKDGWNFFGNETSVDAGSVLKLSSSIGSAVQTSDADFNAGTYKNTAVSGTGGSASVGLTAPAATVLGSNFTGLPAFVLGNPSGIYVETSANKIYATDSNDRIVKFDSGSGGTTLGANFQAFGSYGSADGKFSSPRGIFVDSAGNKAYVVDSSNSRIVKMDSGGGGTTLGDNFQTFGTSGSGSGQFANPNGIAVDSANNKLYVVDTNNGRIIRMDSGGGSTTLGGNFQTFGTFGSGNGQFGYPIGIHGDPSNNRLYVADRNNNRISVFDSGGGSTTFGGNFGSFGTSGTGNGQFRYPRGVYVDSANNKAYVADSGNNRVIRMDSGGGGTTLGNTFQEFGEAGSDAGQFYSNFESLYVDPAINRIYVADNGNGRISILDSGSGGTTFGNGFATFQTSGNRRGNFMAPMGLYFDKEHNKIYVADQNNDRVVKFDSGGGGTILGANFQAFGTRGTGNGQFISPDSVYVDVGDDKMYVSDQYNGRIVKMDAGERSIFGGNFQTFGTVGTGNGQFYAPSGIFVDTANNKAYVVDINNERIVKMDSGGGSTTLGGNFSTYSGMNSDFESGWFFDGIYVDTANDKAYVADSGAGHVYKFDAGGSGASIPGTNLSVLTDPAIDSPSGIIVAGTKVYVTNADAGDVVKFDSGEGGSTLGAEMETFGAYGNEQRNLNARGIFVDSFASKVYVTDAISSSVVAFDSGENTAYGPSGTFTSSVMGVPSLRGAVLAWNGSGAPALSMKVRSAPSAGGLEAKPWSGCAVISSGATLMSGGCSDADDTYVQYQAEFTSNGSTTGSLNDVTVNYGVTATSGELVSSWFDSEHDNNVIGSVHWTAATSAGNAVSLKLQTAPDGGGVPGSPTDWLGPDSTNATSFTHADGSDVLSGSLIAPMNNRWFRYQVSSSSDGTQTPIVSNVTIQRTDGDVTPPASPTGLAVF